MKIAIVVLKNVLKSTAYGMEEIFSFNNKLCKSKEEEEIETTFVGSEEFKYFDCKPFDKKILYDIVIIPPMLKDRLEELITKELISWLKFQHSKKALLASACLGSIVLAKTKLLDRKKATTHWAYEEYFKLNFPKINIDVNKILIDEKDIITAGGVTAYVDLCLYLIEKYFSNRTATQLANLLVVDKGRESQQSYKSFSTVFLYDDKEIKELVFWLKENLHQQISIEDLAKQIDSSSKTFTRRFNKALNISPIKYLQILRAEKAKELLICTNKSFSEITFEVGYFDENSFRKLFKKHTSLNPIEFRKKFQQVITT